MIDRTETRRPIDARLRVSIVAVASCGAALALATLVARDPRTAFSVTVGAAIAAANLWVLARIVSAFLPAERPIPEDHPPGYGAGAWALIAVGKMFGLFAVVWFLMRYAVVSPLPMLVGFGSLPMGIAIGSLVSDRSAPPER